MSTTKPNIVEILHENNQYAQKTKRFFIWMPVNLIILTILMHDIWKRRRINTIVLFAEHALSVIVSLNILYLFSQRFLSQYFPKKFDLSFHQFALLKNLNQRVMNGLSNINVMDDQSSHRQARKSEKISFESFRAVSSSVFPNNCSTFKSNSINDSVKMDKFNVKHYHASPTSLFAGTPIITDSVHDASFHSSIDSSYLGLSGPFDNFSNNSFSSLNLSKSFNNLARDDFIDDVDFAKKYDRPEDKSAHNMSDNSGYWKSRDSLIMRSTNISRTDLILNDVYQLSPTASLESVKPVNEVSSLGANLTVCKKFGVNQAYLSEWIANLRKWITQTILTRIIKEIKEVNHALSIQGITNVNIGSSGLERLKKTAAMSQVHQNIPTLSSLISFLDVSANQEYVVQRISALSTGSMSNYCWNSGGTYEGKPWNESLPTDAALVMHLVAAYFDSQLFPLPHTAPDGRQFSSAHFVKTPTVPVKKKKSLIIYQQTINPPHFQLIIDEDTYDISRGRNNLFHVLLFFLLHIKTKESGMFEHVNLGSSGINMLWIINEPTLSIY